MEETNGPSGGRLQKKRKRLGKQARTGFCDLSSAAKLQLGEERTQRRAGLVYVVRFRKWGGV
jgi:hypothetical protein